MRRQPRVGLGVDSAFVDEVLWFYDAPRLMMDVFVKTGDLTGL